MGSKVQEVQSLKAEDILGNKMDLLGLTFCACLLLPAGFIFLSAACWCIFIFFAALGNF
jgi:hypothetical protein